MGTIKVQNVNRFIAKAYLFLLTIRMISPLVGPTAVLHGISTYFDLFLHILGLVLAIISSGGKLYLGDRESSRLFRLFVKIVIWFVISSIIMSVVIQLTYGNYAGESAFSGVIGQITYYIHYALIILYNIYVFKILSKDEIDRILGVECVFLLILGYYQILCYVVGGIFKTFGNTVDIFSVLFPGEGMLKLSLTATEGAKAGGICAVLVLPYLFSKVLSGVRSRKYYLQIILWIPVVISMQSTSAYLMIFAEVMGFFYFLSKSGNRQRSKFWQMLLLVLLIGSFAILFIPDYYMNSVFNKDAISYLIFSKISDSNNGSTMMRTAPLIINWKVFLRFPIFGVGNGLQGYFYTEFFPQEALSVPGVMNLYSVAHNTIVNGALFFPSILSGYGIVGTTFVCIYIFRMFRVIESKKRNLGIFYMMFKIALVGIVVHGFQTEFAGSYFIWFVLSIPFMPADHEGAIFDCKKVLGEIL